MKLHEAMIQLLETTKQISVDSMVKLINQNNLYIKGDGSPITKNQIYARINRYKHLFMVDNGLIYRR